MAAPVSIAAVPGQRIEIDVPSDAWPYRIQIGDDVAGAWPERYLHRGTVRAKAWRTCPQLGAGVWPLTLHDRTGSRKIGTVTIR